MAIPSDIGRYEVERELGAGGMGEVYLARDPYINRQVAIKVLPRPREQESQLFRARFEREVRIIAAMEHPAIVPVHDFGYHDDQPFIVMRYMAGGTLSDRIKDEPLPIPETIRIFRQIAPALDYIHRQGIVHRDLKPRNILFDLVSNAYIADFGIAKISETSADLTGSATIGSPAYMSPEQARGMEELDRRSDIYSMGVVLFEILTGKVPYKADTPVSQAMAHILEPVPDIKSFRPDLPGSYQTLIYKAMAKERDERFGAMSDLLLALEKAEQEKELDLRVTRVESRRSEPIAHSIEENPPHPLLVWFRRQNKLARIGVLFALLLLTGAFGLGIGIVNLGREGLGPLAYLASPTLTFTPTSTPTFTPTFTSTTTSTPTPPANTPTITLTPTATPFPPSLVDDFGVTMRLVSSGPFQMGSVNGGSDEKPVHYVFLDDYYIDQYEITNALYFSCVDAGVCLDRNTSERKNASYAQYPIRNVSWYDAQAFCEWRGVRLPTEAEWEKAARGGVEGMNYPWGNATPVCTLGAINGAQYGRCDGETITVGSFAPNGYGLYDMAGNVWEWVADWYERAYYTSQIEWTNPTGPDKGYFRGLRGGSWSNIAGDLRTAIRRWYFPDAIYFNYGFRCALSP